MVQCWIAICGSLTSSDGGMDDAARDEAIRAARAVGEALSRKNCGILVYSSSPEFVEPHVVAGYLTNPNALQSSIRVIYARKTQQPAFPEMASRANCFKLIKDEHPNWEVSFYRSVLEADGLILIGGSRSTMTVGILAAARRIPLVSLEAYGGAASTVWELLTPFDGLIVHAEKQQMAERTASPEWADAVVECLIHQRARLHEAEAKARHQADNTHKSLLLTAALGLAMLVAGVSLFVATWDAQLSRIKLLLALTAAAALGGGAASLIRTACERSKAQSLEGRSAGVLALLGVAAGLVSGLLYIIAQLTAFPPGDNGALSPVASRLTPFALITGFLAGFAMDAFFRRVSESEQTPIKLPSLRQLD